MTLQFATELCGKIFGQNVSMQFGAELCGQILGRNVTLQFGVELRGKVFSRFPAPIVPSAMLTTSFVSKKHPERGPDYL